MKKITITIISIFFASQIFAQNITADTTLANKYYSSAKTYLDANKLDSAKFNAENAQLLYIKHLGENSLQNANILNLLGGISYYDNKFDISLKYYLEELEILKIIQDNSLDIALNYSNLRLIYEEKALYDKALSYSYKSLKIYNTISEGQNKYVANEYNSMAILYYRKDEYSKSIELFYKSLLICKNIYGENDFSVASKYNNIGGIYLMQNDYEIALEYFNKSLKIKKKLFGEKHRQVATTYNNIASLYQKKGEPDKALEYFLKSLEIYKQLLGETHKSVALSYSNIGDIYYEKEKYDIAMKYYSNSLNIRLKLFGEKHPDVASSYSDIGNVYMNKSEYGKALEYNLKSLKIRIEYLSEKHTDVAWSYSSIGDIYSKNSEPYKALKYYTKSLAIRKALLGDKHTLVATSYNNIGKTYYDISENEIALQYFQKGIVSCLRNFNDTININAVPFIENYLNWNYLLQALQAKADIFATKNLVGFENSQNLALKHYQACDTLITEVRQEITTKSDKLSLGEQANEIYKGAINVCLKLYQQTNNQEYLQQAFYFSEKNKSSVLLEALAGSEALNFAGIPDTLLNLEHKLNIDIANYINLKNNAKNDSIANIWNDRLFKTNRSYDSLIIVFETKYPDYYNLKYNNSPATVKQTSNLLDKRTAMLSYLVGDSTITIFAISKKDFVVTQITKPDSLNEKIHNYRFYISETDLFVDEIFSGTHWSIAEYEKLAFQFYNLLFPPEIQEFLKGGIFYDIENLIIIPDGQLATMPFETFFSEKYVGKWTDWKSKTYFAEMPYLIKDYNISYSYSATLFQQTKPKEKTDEIEITPLNDWLAFAPVFDDENTAGTTTRTRELLTFSNDTSKTRRFLADGRYVSPLPGTETEITTIFDLYKQQGKKALIKTHQQANESFAKSDELQNYKIIHFATHGFVNEENPKLSGILFAQDTTVTIDSLEYLPHLVAQQNEGILYQSEIYNLKFNADLVVLSACETGLGKITKGEGVIGLTRALLYAGSKNIIVSLWSVNDKSTSKLMISFYENLLNDKKQDKYSKHLSEAKRKMIEDGKYSHPYFWSPFILIGE